MTSLDSQLSSAQHVEIDNKLDLKLHPACLRSLRYISSTVMTFRDL